MNIFKIPLRLLESFFARKFLVLNALIGILCFVVLPGLIVFRGIEAMTSHHISEINSTARHRLENRLDQLEFFSSNDRFAHFLLTSLCKDSDGSEKNLCSLSADIARLKKRFANAFTFVVADRQGKIIPKLSDEKNYAYLYRQAFLLIAECEKAVQQNFQPESLDNIDVRITRLRPVLGDLLRQTDLFMPLKGPRTGQSILVSGSADKFNLWYGTGRDFRLIVYVSRDFIRGNDGLVWAVDRLNRQSPDLLTGISRYPPLSENLIPQIADEQSAKVMLALAKYEDINLESAGDDDQIACSFLNQQWRGFCFFRSGGFSNVVAIRASMFSSLARILLVILFIIAVYQLKTPVSVTVKLKITAFFSYAIVLPLLVIASLSLQYIRQAEGSIINDLQKEAQQTLERIDADLAWYSKNKAADLDDFLSRQLKNRSVDQFSRNELVNFDLDLRKVADHDDAIILNASGNDFLQGISPRISMNHVLVRRIGCDTLKLLVAPDYVSSINKANVLSWEFLGDIYDLQSTITYLGVGDFEMAAYYRLLTPPSGRIDDVLFVAIFWKLSKLHRSFVENYCKTKLISTPRLKIAAFCRDSDRLFVSPDGADSRLTRFMKLSINRQNIRSSDFRLSGSRHVAIAMPGRSLKHIILAALMPADVIEQQTDKIVNKALFFAAFLCLISVATMYLLRSWIFRPLEELRTGIRAIGERAFHKRLNLVCNNELGRLMSAFNYSLETLQELEVARIVQESILPEPRMTVNRVEVVAQTLAMSGLGGDYFDMIKLDDQKLLVFIGDATGHGIPAALSMAMAKATLIHENNRSLSPENLMQQLDKLFAKLRKHGVKDYMTALCVEIDSMSGVVRIINAGHCFPILLESLTGKARLLKAARGLPAGFDAYGSSKPAEIKLAPGDSLILYTDGFIECSSPSGEPVGFDGLIKIVELAQTVDLTAHVAGIFQHLKQWSEHRQDDCTMIILRFS